MAGTWRRMLPFVAYSVLIFVGSSIPGLAPPGPEALPKDKIAHFVEYFILGVLLARGVVWREGWSMLAFLVAIGATVGAVDEVYQSYVPGRDMSTADWAADTVGAATGISAFAFTRWRRAGARPVQRGGSA